jgi:L,D-transpeptidase YcbB
MKVHMQIRTACLTAVCLLALATAPAPALAKRSGSAAKEAATAATQAVTVADHIRERSTGRLASFYQQRGFQPFWIANGRLSPVAESFLALLRTSQADRFVPDAFAISELERVANWSGDTSPSGLAAAELTIAREFTRYVQSVRQVSAQLRYLEPGVAPQVLAEDEILRRVASAASPSEYITQMQWMNPHYAMLRAAIIRYGQFWENLPQTQISAGAALKEGESGQRVAQLRHRLGLTPGEHFDREVADKLRAFQADHGLEPDGVLGSRTVAVLNEGPAGFLRKLQINLERARDLPAPDVRHILVNSAAARLWYYENGQAKGGMKVIVGTARTPTPSVAGLMHYATLNPYWNVPVDLVKRNIAPSVARGAPLKSTYEVLSDWTADAQVIDPSTVDWRAVAAGDKQIRLRQLPGRHNAMGDVKFIFADELGIYLHDTPDRHLFDKPSRHFSNGCIRLEQADDLLNWLAGGQLGASAHQPEQHLLLPSPVPVYIAYLTALPHEGGIAFVDDVYHRDRADAAHLAGRHARNPVPLSAHPEEPLGEVEAPSHSPS